ncbi:cupin domain-containing protein [Halostella salina]|uniref:cupin domain-containing protein n=1 Tax=Halostella salina TaxID=1547897 RepID=UPI000EF78A61|nr:cupin domain-containing protein [Halostella salina]
MGKVNAEDVEPARTERGDTAFERRKLAAAADGDRIGCSLYRIPPGRRSWPYHYHTGNEEAIFVLSGEGSLRLDGERVPLETDDYVALPPGEDSGHRVINDSDEPLRYLMVSTMDDPDVTVYPDSGKVGVFAGSAPGSEAERTVHGYYRADDAVDYWVDEDGPSGDE